MTTETTPLKSSPYFYYLANRQQFDVFCRAYNLTPGNAVYLDRNEKVYGINADTFNKIVGVGPDVNGDVLASRGFKHG